MATLAEIRAKLAAQDNKQQAGSGDNTIYAHWNIEEGQTCTLRFLPDGDEDNTYFWIERQMIKLPFAGIKGDPSSKPMTVQVPCMEMWEATGSCPVLAEVRPWFKDPSLEEVARKYWKKRSYIMQGYVRKDPTNEDGPDKLRRRFIISPQIFALIKSALMDPELEEMPTDYLLGLDFHVAKTNKGGWADYSTSKWARKESALTPDEKTELDEDGLLDLKTFLPKKPDAKHLEIIKEMFEASVDGEAYDPDRWAQYYRPPGLDKPSTPAAVNSPAAPQAEAPAPKAEAAPADDDIPFVADAEPKVEEKAPADSGSKAEDILAMIRSRQNA